MKNRNNFIPWIYHPDYDIPLPTNHRFTAKKHADLLSLLKKSKISDKSRIFKPKPANRDQIHLVHTKSYVDKIESGNLSKSEKNILGLPWSKELLKRAYLDINGTLTAAKLALKHSIACHLAGGTHHAHANFGSGFCVFNDIAFAAKNLIHEYICKKVLIIDCDVHQGDGTASICSDEPDIYTCSMHAKNNFPLEKINSDYDIPLEDEISNEEYMNKIIYMLDICNREISPDLVIYDAGVDVHQNDKLGRLKINSETIMKRDLAILDYFKQKSIPICTVIGGGYSEDRNELAKRHTIIFNAAHRIYCAS